MNRKGIALPLAAAVLWAALANAQPAPETFFVGGHYASTPEGNLMLGQMYVERHLPARASHAVPIVVVHGSGQTGTGFVSTPDGRPGWAQNFVDRGWTVFVVDQVGRGRSALFSGIQGPLTHFTIEQTEEMFTAPARHMLWPQAALHTQWPGTGMRGDPTFDAFYAAEVEGIADLTRVEELNAAALIALLDRIGPAVLLTHSQAGPYGWVVADRRPELVRGLVAVEPDGPPFMEGTWVGAPAWYRESGALAFPWGITHLPLSFEPAVASASEIGRVREVRSGDPGLAPCWNQSDPPRRLPHLAGIPTVIVTAEASFRAGIDDCTVAFLSKAGVLAQHLRLADHGIRGNGHMMMLEGNNAEIADAITSWLDAHVH